MSEETKAAPPKTKHPLRIEVGLILGEAIPPKQWDRKFKEYAVSGRFDQKKIMQILAVILAKLEEYEELE